MLRTRSQQSSCRNLTSPPCPRGCCLCCNGVWRRTRRNGCGILETWNCCWWRLQPLPQLSSSPLGGVAANKVAWGVAALLAVVALGVSFVHFREAPPADPVLHLSVPLPENSIAGFLALSPDGRRIVIGFDTESKEQLWLRSLDSPQLQLLPGTDSARGPFWSPDGKSIGFFADGKLKTMPATGGPPQILCDGTGAVAGGTWNRDGVILFSTNGVSDPVRRVNAAGGACVAVTTPEGDSRHLFPEFLPDGKHFVYLVNGGDEASGASMLPHSTIPFPAGFFRMCPAPYSLRPLPGKNTGISCFCAGAR